MPSGRQSGSMTAVNIVEPAVNCEAVSVYTGEPSRRPAKNHRDCSGLIE
jgi:hypothetical protein